MLVDAAGNVRLTGFGIASRLPRERQAPAPPEVIAGTLAYMAPEQTGRMNRSIDARSDLYSLGVTLYEMLTGTLPFTASDPMEWIHCHIARQPMPPRERVDGIPEPVAAIVMKLLAKTAEDRYQTAAGVEADLRRCLAAWEAHRPHRAVPARRARRVGPAADPGEALRTRAPRSTRCSPPSSGSSTSGSTELVLVSGYSGIGKSSVVNELHKVLVPPRGLFAAGKFDQYKRDIPYATLAQAFQSLVRQIARQERCGAGPLARRAAGGARPERPAHGQPDPGACAHHRRAAAGSRAPAAGRAAAASRWCSGASSACSPGRSIRSRCSSTICNGWTRRRSTCSSIWSREPEVRHLLLVGAYRDNEVGRRRTR